MESRTLCWTSGALLGLILSAGCTPFTTLRVGGGAASHKTEVSPIAAAAFGFGGSTYTESLQATADLQVGPNLFMIGAGPELEFHNLRMIQRADKKLLLKWRIRPEGGFRSVAGNQTGYVGASASIFAQPWQLLFGLGDQSALFGAVALNVMAGRAFKPGSDAGGFFVSSTLTVDWGISYGE